MSTKLYLSGRENMFPTMRDCLLFSRERRKDKCNVMTLLYTESEFENPAIGLEAKDGKLVYYHQEEPSSHLELDKRLFFADTYIRRDLRDTGIALCSPNICAQYSDNFDFQHKGDIIKEILANEEILCQYIHVDILPPTVSAFSVNDYVDLLHVNRLMLQRWLAPLTLGLVGDTRFISRRNNVFYAISGQADYSSRVTYIDGFNIVVGLNCSISPSANIRNSSIGNNCRLGMSCFYHLFCRSCSRCF
ncbi:hypothetical protein AB6A40_009520 [Gnathostoma spinigerum]|uniref:CN hydrolase domain-containing protein n=1 Tax=Gnathostoma spinigerum TaxID=75299 RepID=A0ABD6EZ94_9BILA